VRLRGKAGDTIKLFRGVVIAASAIEIGALEEFGAQEAIRIFAW